MSSAGTRFVTGGLRTGGFSWVFDMLGHLR
jgi:hypothetical protein